MSLNRSVVPLALGLLVVIAIFAAVMLLTSQLQEAAVVLRHRVQISAAIPRILETVQDAETGQRGYLLTGKDPYLGPYKSAVTNVGERLADLRDLTTGDTYFDATRPALEATVNGKLDELAQTIASFQTDREKALSIVDSDRGRDLMIQIRRVLDDMTAHQSAALTDSFATRDRIARDLQASVAVGLLALLLVSAIAVMDARRRQRALAEQARELAQKNVALIAANEQLRDEIESRRAAEDQVRQLQKMEAVGQLTGGIAHDFNNALAVVLSAIGLIRRRLAAGNTDIAKFLDGAAEAADGAASLTRRLLAFSRQQALDPEPLDVNRLVSTMSQLLRSTLGEAVALEAVLAGGLWRIHADARQLENSILNLAVNSRDAMPEGGKITIETANAYLDEAYARENPGASVGQYVMISVTDTGTGMSTEVAAKAFDPFFTTKGPGRGTGLGLSQVYGFIKQSQGHIKIYSEIGTGTSVKVYIPRYLGSDAERARKTAADVAIESGSAAEVVLVVEDDDRVRAMAVESLQQVGYTVLAAPSGADALKLLGEREDVTLLFTDIVMPGMSGRKLADEALARRPKLKVLYTTGFTRNAVVHNGVLDAGVQFIQKPFTIEALAAKVRETIDS